MPARVLAVEHVAVEDDRPERVPLSDPDRPPRTSAPMRRSPPSGGRRLSTTRSERSPCRPASRTHAVSALRISFTVVATSPGGCPELVGAVTANLAIDLPLVLQAGFVVDGVELVVEGLGGTVGGDELADGVRETRSSSSITASAYSTVTVAGFMVMSIAGGSGRGGRRRRQSRHGPSSGTVAPGRSCAASAAAGRQHERQARRRARPPSPAKTDIDGSPPQPHKPHSHEFDTETTTPFHGFPRTRSPTRAHQQRRCYTQRAVPFDIGWLASVGGSPRFSLAQDAGEEARPTHGDRRTTVRQLVEPLVTPHGIELVDVERGPGLLRIYLDFTDPQRPSTWTPSRRFSEQISDLLDTPGNDLIPGRYTLEVSSPASNARSRPQGAVPAVRRHGRQHQDQVQRRGRTPLPGHPSRKPPTRHSRPSATAPSATRTSTRPRRSSSGARRPKTNAAPKKTKKATTS